MLEQANEVQDALGRQYGMPEIDDADLDAGTISGDSIDTKKAFIFLSYLIFHYFLPQSILCIAET